MKITAKKYAEALFEATKNKNEEEAAKAIGRLVDILFENKDLNKADAIMKYFIKNWNKNKGIAAVDVVMAKKADEELLEKINNYVAKILNAKEIEIREKVDKSIIGGIIIRHGDKIYDGSLKSRLYGLKEKLIK